MTAALDRMTDMAFTNNWRTVKMNLAPGISQLTGVHPDVIRIMLRSGFKILILI